LGISVGGLNKGEMDQLSLIYEEKENEKMKKLEFVIDDIRNNLGQDIIKRGAPEERTHKSVKDKLDYL